jgi:arylsulfatase
MEIYAAMVSDVDRYLGELLSWLREVGEYDDTLIVVLSDNGPEGHHLDVGWDALQRWVDSCCDNSLENLGRADSYTWYGPNWGAAGNTPARMFKGYVAQGGVRVPALVHMPARLQKNRRSDAVVHVTDVMPTLLEVAGVAHPGERYRGRSVHPLEGRSLLPLLEGTADAVHPEDHFLAWELFGKRAVRHGRWKALYLPDHDHLPALPAGIEAGRWQLFDLENDPAELRDLSAARPERLQALVALWDRYAREKGVILPDRTSGY